MRQFALSLVLTMMATSSSQAILVIDSIETAPSQFEIEITTDVTFDTLEIQVDGDVDNGVNIVPIHPILLTRVIISPPTQLSPLGSPSTDGVIEPGINSDIDLTYGVTNPVPGTWTVGLMNAAFLRFDLLSGMADVTVNLRLGGPVVATSTVQVIAAVPEAGAVLCLSIITSGAVLAALYLRAKGPRLPTRHSPAFDGKG
jgi:hypothetical protein